MNILCLHRMGDPNNWLESVRTLEYMFADVRHDLNVVVHDSDVPFPSYMKDINYDLIILGPTFLCNRYSRKKLKTVFSNFEFIKYSKACKVALPQDEYDCSQILEDWLIDWDINLVYSVCFEHRFILYPRLSKKALIRLGYAGYISEDWINFWKSPRPIEQRSIDVGYRASKLPANFGRLGQLKWEIAERFLKAIEGSNNKMKLDISIDPKDWFPGKYWYNFLENSKFCLVTASGSSLLDPKGDIRFCVNKFIEHNLKANFHEIEMKCFTGKDNKNKYTALSPRNIEAALAETVQIATPGSYSELMQPYEHFIPLAEDCSNIKEVIKMMTDMPQIKKIQKICKEKFLSESRLRCKNIVNEIVNFAEDYLSHQSGIAIDQVCAKIAMDRYRAEIKQIVNSYFRRRRFLLKAREISFKLGGKRIYDLIFNYR